MFIQFVFTPWMMARESARAPKRVDAGVSGHVILTGLDVVTDALIERLDASKIPYVLLVDEIEEALRLHDRGYSVVLGAVDDPATYEAAGVERAALVATTRADTTNTNIAFTVREFTEDVPIVATANSAASVDILELAGCDHVLQLGDLLGRAMARRVLGGDHASHIVGEFGDLHIAEASVAGTNLVGQRLLDLDLRRRCGVNVLGVWQRGSFERAGPATHLHDESVLILAGTTEQLERYDDEHATELPVEQPVIILGGGRVGRAAARALDERRVPSVIVEKRLDRITNELDYVRGDAAELEVLQSAGLDKAAATLVTTHEDDVNVYLTLYCRKLRPDLQVISRSTLERNVSTLHRAGADAVLSYASLGATALWNAFGDDTRLVIAEGLEVFQLPIPERLAGRSLADADVGAKTGCNVLAIERDGTIESNPDPSTPLPIAGDLVIIGDEEAQRKFVKRYPPNSRG